jgi:hypothetical protein
MESYSPVKTPDAVHITVITPDPAGQNLMTPPDCGLAPRCTAVSPGTNFPGLRLGVPLAPDGFFSPQD